jgi:hypothetical protein
VLLPEELPLALPIPIEEKDVGTPTDEDGPVPVTAEGAIPVLRPPTEGGVAAISCEETGMETVIGAAPGITFVAGGSRPGLSSLALPTAVKVLAGRKLAVL